MKKFVSVLLVVALALSIVCIGTSAVDETKPTASGIYNAAAVQSLSTKVTVTPDGTVNNTFTDYPNFYADAEFVTLTYTGATAGSYYMALVTETEIDGVPTADDEIFFIDQVAAAANGTVSFKVYPKELNAGKTYHIYLMSNGTGTGDIKVLTEVATFQYYAPYTLGDVNGDGAITASDALLVLGYVVKSVSLDDTELLAADVTQDGNVTSSDALCILNYVVKIITEF